MFNRIYGIMKFVGLGISLFAAAIFIKNGDYLNTGYSLLILAIIVLIVITGLIDMLSKLGKARILKEETRQVVIGHVTMMLGVSALIAALLGSRGVTISSALGVIAVLIVFMMTMLFVLLRIFKMLNDLVNTTEKNDSEESEIE